MLVISKTTLALHTLLYSAALLCISGAVSADTLEDLQKSPVLQEMEDRSARDKIRLNRYSEDLPRDREYSRLFVKKKGLQLINFWLGVNNPDFKLNSDNKCTKTERTARCILRYFGPKGKKIEVQVLVPNPNFLTLAEFGFVPEIAQFKPPKLQVKKQEEVKIGELEAFFYETPEEVCSYFIPLNKQAVVNGKAHCSIKKELKQVLETLNISRLNSRLVQ